MAQITQVKLVDDLDGGEAAESLAFSLDGKSYEIDLSDTHAAALRDAFAPFITNARRAGSGPKVVSRQRMSMRTGRAREETAAIREWAHAHGLAVSTRGRISSTVLEAYENRGNVQTAPAVAKNPAATPVAASTAEPEAVVEAEVKPKRRTRRKVTSEG
jgi:Lsr2